MKISFIGLGAMGFPMAGHLAKTHTLQVWNRTQAVAERHAAAHGTRVAQDLAECADAEAIITMLPSSREVDSMVDALLPHLPAGALWIDATSGDPAASKATAARLAARGVAWADAPVTGAVVGAQNATLTIMIGSSPEVFARAKAVLEPCGRKIIHAGPVGAGHAIKALTNTIMGATVWVTAECLLLARKYGVDLATALEVTNHGSGRSNASENLLPLRLVEKEWPLVFKLALHDKDIRIAAAMAHREHASTPLLGLTSALYTGALHQLPEDADYIEVVKIVAAMNGETW